MAWAASIGLVGPDSQRVPADIVVAESGMFVFVNPRTLLGQGKYDSGASDRQGNAERAFNSARRKLPPLTAGPA